MDSTLWQAVLYLHLVAMAFFLGGQLLLAAAVVPALRGLQVKLSLVAVALLLTAAHLRYSRAHVLQAATFLVTLAIVWEAVQLAT